MLLPLLYSQALSRKERGAGLIKLFRQALRKENFLGPSNLFFEIINEDLF